MLSIGQFSKACRVSIKTLRHYDRIGLMHPTRVDAWTGYRYYQEDSIATILLIQRLKRYGFSLAEIKNMLDPGKNPLWLLDRLQRQRAVLAGKAEAVRLAMGELDRHLINFERTGDIMDYQNQYQVSIEKDRDRALLSSRQQMSVSDFGLYFGKLFERVARESIETDGTVLSIYYDEAFDHDCTDIEVALGVSHPQDATRVMKGGLVATTVHVGPYSSLSDAYGALTRWIGENGYRANGAPYEFYLKDHRSGLGPEDWQTKVCFPVRMV